MRVARREFVARLRRNVGHFGEDATEGFVLETAGHYWALLECRHSRAVTDAAMIRQDWRRLAPGLADCVIERGW